MTNKEKTREIAAKYFPVGSPHYTTEVVAQIDCQNAVNEMAEWKDKQFAEEFELIKDWFNHIAQIADDKKTLNGFVMKDSDAFDEIKCLAKRCADYIENGLYKK